MLYKHNNQYIRMIFNLTFSLYIKLYILLPSWDLIVFYFQRGIFLNCHLNGKHAHICPGFFSFPNSVVLDMVWFAHAGLRYLCVLSVLPVAKWTLFGFCVVSCAEIRRQSQPGRGCQSRWNSLEEVGSREIRPQTKPCLNQKKYTQNSA